MSLWPGEQYEPFLQFAIELGKEASRLIQQGQLKRLSVSPSSANADSTGQGNDSVALKKNTVDLVTETDEAVEAFIKQRIAAEFPDHKFIGEETYAVDGKMDLTDDFTWIVDPIDGTTNFVHTHPFVGCSIGLSHHRTPVVGVCVLPFVSYPTIVPSNLGSLYSARLGGGAWINEQVRLPVGGGARPLNTLQECAVTTGWGTERFVSMVGARSRSMERLIKDKRDGGEMVHTVHISTSTVVAMMQVATGQLDVYWDSGPYPWDVCAGAVIVKEAGGLFLGGVQSFTRGKDHIGDIMMSRRYCVIRAVAPSKEETAEAIQHRIIGDLYKIIEQPSNSLWGASEHD